MFDMDMKDWIIFLLLICCVIVIIGVGVAAYTDGTKIVAEYACVEAGFDSGDWENGKIICQKLEALIGE